MPLPGALRLIALAACAAAISSCVDSALTPPPGNGARANSNVRWVIVSPASASLKAGASVQLQVQLQDADGQALGDQSVHWTSSDTTIASVSSSGVVQARKAGAAKVTASAGATSAQAQVNVTTAAPPTIYVSVSPTSATIAAGSARQLWAAVKYADGKVVPNATISWLSSNTAVATVSQAGLVTGVKAGLAAVTARSGTSSAASAVTITATSSAPPPPSTPPPPPPPPTAPAAPPPPTGSLFSGYSTTSPHWPHIRTMMTDFYYAWTPSERTWAGQHYDFSMSGDGAAWRAANPTVGHYPYTLLWTTTIATSGGGNITGTYYTDMQQWYAQHTQYNIEAAWLHVGGAAADSAHRIVVGIWDSRRWILNPADAGARAYSIDRFQRVVAGEAGAFIDETASGDIGKQLTGAAEFPDAASYLAAYASLLQAIEGAITPKRLILNTGPYTGAADFTDIMAGGATHLEKTNNPLHSGTPDVWSWIDRLTAAGAFVDFVNSYDYADAQSLVATYPPGNSTTTYERLKMWELASYYMVVGQTPDRVALQLVNAWNMPYSSLWLKAQEANIGHPTGARATIVTGTDPVGQAYRIYSRDFDRALVLVRAQQGWGSQSYLDNTAVTVPLPAGETWLPLHGNGSLGAAVTSVKLRNSEAIILVKQRTIS